MEPHLRALADSKFACLWLDQDARPERLDPLKGSQRCELLIVGGGFTGMWAALQAKEKHPELDIILIEATEIGDGASGRNGGFLSASLAHGDNNTDYHFPGEKERLTQLGHQNLREFIDTLDRYNIDARYEGTGSLSVTTRLDQNEELIEEASELGDDAVWFDREEIQREIHSPTYMGGLWDRRGQAGLVDPAYLCWGLKKTIVSLGVRVFEGTPMVRMDPRSEGMTIECPDGSVRCQKILMATNAFRSPVGQIRRSVIPVFDYLLATEPMTPEQQELVGWKRRQGLSNAANMFHYYRLTHDNRIVWGGGTTVCYYYGNRTEGAVTDPPQRMERLAADFFETFPQLEGIRFTHRWSGIIASSTRFCMVPGSAYDGRLAWSVGYTGQGVGATRFGARIALEMLGYYPTDVLDMNFVSKKTLPWPPEPLRWIGVTLTRSEMDRADRNNGKRGLWLKILDRLNLGFAC